jgi:hypothetical protein
MHTTAAMTVLKTSARISGVILKTSLLGQNGPVKEPRSVNPYLGQAGVAKEKVVTESHV